MDDSLAQSLAQLNLQPGQSQRIQVNGYQLEIRRPAEEERSRFEEMVMLEPWVTFPDPEPRGTVPVRLGTLPLPDPPDIPGDDDGGEP